MSSYLTAASILRSVSRTPLPPQLLCTSRMTAWIAALWATADTPLFLEPVDAAGRRLEFDPSVRLQEKADDATDQKRNREERVNDEDVVEGHSVTAQRQEKRRSVSRAGIEEHVGQKAPQKQAPPAPRRRPGRVPPGPPGDQPAKDGAKDQREEEGVCDAPMTSQRADVILESGKDQVRVGQAAGHGSPEHCPVADLPAQNGLTDRGTEGGMGHHVHDLHGSSG